MDYFVINYCRLCAAIMNKQDRMMSLQTDTRRLKNVIMKLDRINACVDFCDTILAKTVCLLCLETLDKAFDFVQTVEQAQTTLKELFLITSTVTENVSNSEEIDVKDEPEVKRENSLDREISDEHSSEQTDLDNKIVEVEEEDAEKDKYVPMSPDLPQQPLNEDILPPQEILRNTENKSSYIENVRNLHVFVEFESETEMNTWRHFAWICVDCETRFATVDELKDHLITIHKHCNGFRCPDCNSYKSTLKAFIGHMICHRHYLRNSCYKCFRKFQSTRLLARHVAGHKDSEFLCFGCHTTYPSSEELNIHTTAYYKKWQLKKHSVQYNYFCESCGKGFLQYCLLQKHIFTHHMIERQFHCDHCKQSFKRKDLIKKHLKKNCTIRKKYPCLEFESDADSQAWRNLKWICKICDISFLTVDEIQKHSMTDHNCCNAYRCPDCKSYKFKLDTFIEHMKCHRPNLRKSCYMCFGKFKSSYYLGKHVAEHRDSDHICLGCNTTYQSTEELKTHTTAYYKEWQPVRMEPHIVDLKLLKCLLCDKTFSRRTSLRGHVRINHEDGIEENHVCEVCGKRFFYKSLLEEHFITHHSTQRPFECDHCKLRFKKKVLVKLHIIRKHDTRKPYVCKQCGRAFKFNSRRLQHMRTHVDVNKLTRPFVCNVCNKAFRLKKGLAEHMHQHTGAKPYSCKMCPRTFASSANCYKHMKRKHKYVKGKKLINIEADYNSK